MVGILHPALFLPWLTLQIGYKIMQFLQVKYLDLPQLFLATWLIVALSQSLGLFLTEITPLNSSFREAPPVVNSVFVTRIYFAFMLKQ